MNVEARVAEVERQLAAHRFGWGVCDCALSVAVVVDAIQGSNLAGMYRRTYTTQVGAARIVSQFGARNVEGLVKHFARVYRWRSVKPYFASIGDIFIARGDDGIFLGFVGSTGPMALGPDGLAEIDRSHLLKAWRVAR